MQQLILYLQQRVKKYYKIIYILVYCKNNLFVLASYCKLQIFVRDSLCEFHDGSKHFSCKNLYFGIKFIKYTYRYNTVS